MSTWKPTPPPQFIYKKNLFKNLAQTADFIYQIGELDALRVPSTKVEVEKITSPEYNAKFTYLKKCMKLYRKRTGKGRGIAAIQVGIPEKFFILYSPERSLEVVINPSITKASSRKFRYPEQCMSCNGLIANVIRPAWVEFEYYTEAGGKKKWSMKDTTKRGRMYNRVVQHEIDHLDGVINIDKVSSRELIFESSKEYYEKASFEEIHQKSTLSSKEREITE